MAEVERVSGKMQFDTERAHVRAAYEMAVEGNKAVASFTGEIGVTNAELGKEEAAGSFNSGIAVTKCTVGNKEAGWMVTEDRWITYVFLTEPPAWFKPNAEPPTATITKEKVPESLVNILKDRRLLLKMPPVNKASPLYIRFPDLLDMHLSVTNDRNTCVDLHADILRQLKEKKWPEVGVDFSEGVKKVFVLPQ